jgi:hypothetical protein
MVLVLIRFLPHYVYIDNLVGEVMCNKFVSLAIQWEDATPVAATGGTLLYLCCCGAAQWLRGCCIKLNL